ncbi:hypothetical protein BGZ72_003496 [Mortierella alpina]|nr:hypothetical protein BGZ72_003496 [Mortierella alpina]
MTTVDDIREQLRQLGLDTRGNKSAIKARLRKHLKKDPSQSQSSETSSQAKAQGADGDGSVDSDSEETRVIEKEKDTTKEQTVDMSEPPRKTLHMNSRYDYYLCFDVEATCEKGFSFEFPNEVIEFPVVLLDGSTFEVVDEFHSYVKPTNRPILSDFCIELTGISQQTIDEAPTFTEVLSLFEAWLTKHHIILGEYTPSNIGTDSNNKKAKKSKSQKGRKNNTSNNPFHHAQSTAAINDFSYGATFCFVTDGPFDIRDFIGKQCLHSGIARPSYFAQSYLDIRTLFRVYFDLIHWLNLEGMLKFLGEAFEGRQHSGICDARMVGLIARRLANGFSYEQDLNDTSDNDNGYDNDSNNYNSAAVFSEENKPYIATQWSHAKLEKLKAGCVLKANRSTGQTFVKMMPFRRLAKLEALPALVAAGASMPPPQPKKSSEPEDVDDGRPMDQDADCFGEASSSPRNGSSPPLSKISSPESSPRISPTKAVSFVQESMFAALMSD